MSDMYKQEELLSVRDNGDESLTDDVACCPRYRECSDAGVCVVPDADYSANCIYRKSLKRGKIFYGKRASDFSASEYEEILNRIDKLKRSDRVAFDEMVIDFCEYNRGAPYRIVRNQHISALSSVGVFSFHTPEMEFLNACSFRFYLEPLFKEVPLFKSAACIRKEEHKRLDDEINAAKRINDKKKEKDLRQEKKQLPGSDTITFMCEWLCQEARPLLDAITMPYRTARPRPEMRRYLEEYYQDYLRDGFDTRIYARSPLAEDGIIAASAVEEEELRRLSLSRGYPVEESSRRISNLQTLLTSGDHNIFLDMMCVITGDLSVPRSSAFFDIQRCGGRVSDTPVNTMDILIIGNQSWSEKNNGVASRKIQKAFELQKSGKDIMILQEDEYSMMMRSAMQFA